VKPSLPTDQ